MTWLDCLSVDLITDEFERCLKIPVGGLEGIRVDGERGAEDDEGGAVFGAAHGLLDGESADGLHGDGNRRDDVAEAVKRAGHAFAARGDAAAFVISDVVHDVIAAEIFEALCGRDHVGRISVADGAWVWGWADDAVPTPAGNTPQSTSPERLSARSLDGQIARFNDLLGGDGKAVCFTFLHPACPLAQRYGPVLAELADEFDPQGIRFVGVVCEFDEIAEITGYLRAARRSLAGGAALPGPDTGGDYDDLAFALPANASATYCKRKFPPATERLGEVARIWDAE